MVLTNYIKVKYFYFTFFCFCSFSFFSQKNKLIPTGNVIYKYRLESSDSKLDGERKAVEYAKIKAIENIFGRNLTQNNTMLIENTQSGQNVKTNQSFSSLTDSYVKGEWIKDKNGFPIIQQQIFNNEIWFIVTVNGFVREIGESLRDFESYSLNCKNLECKTNDFKDGNDLFQYFKSAVDGYLAIYLEDPQLEETSLLLPYSESTTSSYPVKGDSSYFLFYKPKYDDNFIEDNNLCIIGNIIDEIELSLDYNRFTENFLVYILFSTEEFRKPALTDKTNDYKEELDLGKYTLPRSLKSDEFSRWQQRIRMTNENIQLFSYGISLSKN